MSLYIFAGATLYSKNESFSYPFSVALIFGMVLLMAGIVGLTLGSGLSYFLRPRFRWIDPIICGSGLILSAILLVITFVTMYNNIISAYIMMFFGLVCGFLNVAVTVDMSMVSANTVKPQKSTIK